MRLQHLLFPLLLAETYARTDNDLRNFVMPIFQSMIRATTGIQSWYDKESRSYEYRIDTPGLAEEDISVAAEKFRNTYFLIIKPKGQGQSLLDSSGQVTQPTNATSSDAVPSIADVEDDDVEDDDVEDDFQDDDTKESRVAPSQQPPSLVSPQAKPSTVNQQQSPTVQPVKQPQLQTPQTAFADEDDDDFEDYDNYEDFDDDKDVQRQPFWDDFPFLPGRRDRDRYPDRDRDRYPDRDRDRYPDRHRDRYPDRDRDRHGPPYPPHGPPHRPPHRHGMLRAPKLRAEEIRILLPEDADVQNMSYRAKNGLLSISVPKKF